MKQSESVKDLLPHWGIILTVAMLISAVMILSFPSPVAAARAVTVGVIIPQDIPLRDSSSHQG